MKMESCLLCLEINKGTLDSIKANSTRWQELNILKIIEKHFWPLNSMQTNSWICLSCWQEVDGFHKFYMRIEEAHMNFGKIKVEDIEGASIEYVEKLTIPKTKIKNNEEEPDRDNIAFCFLEPEIHINQPQSQDLIETAKIEPIDGIEIDDIPFKPANKRRKLQNVLASKDPLEKSQETKVSKTRTRKSLRTKPSTETKTTEENNAEELKVKEPTDMNKNKNPDRVGDNDNNAVNTQSGKDSSETVEIKTRKTYGKHRTNRKENDKFIAEHFKQMFCDLCQVPFEDFPDMQKHFADNHNQRGYVVCCRRKFFDRTLLVDHIRCHLNPDHFKCAECGKVMSDRLRLENHVMRVHRADEVVRKHCCDVCGKSFTDAHSLRSHKLTHLPEEEKEFPCNECGKFYGSSYLLKRHTQTVHLRKFVKICHVCGKSISTSADYKIHMDKHEGIPQPIINCDICGLRVTSERGVRLHKETQHPVGGKQEHPCPICPKISPTPKALRKHIITMHEKGNNHKCTICEKAFKRAEALREHMASHTGTPLYTCPWCPKTFNSNGNMHAHRKKAHPKEWEEAKLQKYSRNLSEQAEQPDLTIYRHFNDL